MLYISSNVKHSEHNRDHQMSRSTSLSFYNWGDLDPEQGRELPKVFQLVNSRTRMRTQVFWPPIMGSFYYTRLSLNIKEKLIARCMKDKKEINS